MCGINITLVSSDKASATKVLRNIAELIDAGCYHGTGVFEGGRYEFKFLGEASSSSEDSETQAPLQIEDKFFDHNRKPITQKEIETAYEKGYARLIHHESPAFSSYTVALVIDEDVAANILPRRRVLAGDLRLDVDTFWWLTLPESLDECLGIAKGDKNALKTARNNYR